MVEVNENNQEQFYADIISSSDVLRITIPKTIIEVASLKVGERLKVIIEKVEWMKRRECREIDEIVSIMVTIESLVKETKQRIEELFDEWFIRKANIG